MVDLNDSQANGCYHGGFIDLLSIQYKIVGLLK